MLGKYSHCGEDIRGNKILFPCLHDPLGNAFGQTAVEMLLYGSGIAHLVHIWLEKNARTFEDGVVLEVGPKVPIGSTGLR